MKRIVLIFGVILCISLVLLGLSGCFTDNSAAIQFEREWGFHPTVYHDGGDIIMDEESAIAIATAYIETMIESKAYAAGYTYASIIYDSDNKAWLVTFMPEEGSTQLPCNVALKRNGEVTIAWGEP